MPVVQEHGLGNGSLCHQTYQSKIHGKAKKYLNPCNNWTPGTGRPRESTHSKTNTDNDIQNNKTTSNPLTKRKRALLIECEQDILRLLKTYLESLGLETAATDSCDKTINCMFDYDNKPKHECDGVRPITNKEEDYDIIIINNRLPSENGIEMAKEIRKIKPSQRIILITTQPLEHLPMEHLRNANINSEDILTMPFRLSQLRNLIGHCKR